MKLGRSLTASLLVLSFAPTQLSLGQDTSHFATRAERENEVRAALVRYLAQDWGGDDRVFFISIEEKDPSDEFVARLKGFANPIKKASQSKNVQEGKTFFSHIRDKATDRPGVIFSVGRISWKSKNEAEVEGGYYCGSLCGGDSRYRVKYKDKKWQVEPGDTMWNS